MQRVKEGGSYQPCAIVSTNGANAAKAATDKRSRARQRSRGQKPPIAMSACGQLVLAYNRKGLYRRVSLFGLARRQCYEEYFDCSHGPWMFQSLPTGESSRASHAAP